VRRSRRLHMLGAPDEAPAGAPGAPHRRPGWWPLLRWRVPV